MGGDKTPEVLTTSVVLCALCCKTFAGNPGPGANLGQIQQSKFLKMPPRSRGGAAATIWIVLMICPCTGLIGLRAAKISTHALLQYIHRKPLRNPDRGSFLSLRGGECVHAVVPDDLPDMEKALVHLEQQKVSLRFVRGCVHCHRRELRCTPSEMRRRSILTPPLLPCAKWQYNDVKIVVRSGVHHLASQSGRIVLENPRRKLVILGQAGTEMNGHWRIIDGSGEIRNLALYDVVKMNEDDVVFIDEYGDNCLTVHGGFWSFEDCEVTWQNVAHVLLPLFVIL